VSNSSQPVQYFELKHMMFGVHDEVAQELVFAIEARDEDEAHVRAEYARKFLGIRDSHPLIVERLRAHPDRVPMFLESYFRSIELPKQH